LPTDLYVSAFRWPEDSLARVVPPSCYRGVVAAPPPQRDGDSTIVELLEWSPRHPAHRLVPALSALAPNLPAFRFELSVFSAGAWSPWVAGATVGNASLPPAAATTPALVAQIDEFVAAAPAERVRMILRVGAGAGDAPLTSPWLVTLSAWSPVVPEASPARGSARLVVPALSQMEEDPAIRSRICSPTCVAMVLAYYGTRVAVADLAREIFHADLDIYGVWPSAVRAAGRRGIAGYLLRFPDWGAAEWCLAQGMPIIASLRYAAGELTGAAVAETSGHLLVLTGWSGDDVLVNDPAAPTAAGVSRRYRLAELRRVWLERAGVGYVLFRPSPSAVP
jgi:hypothetical protein